MLSLQPNSIPTPPLSIGLLEWSVLTVSCWKLTWIEKLHRQEWTICPGWGAGHESGHITMSPGHVDHNLSFLSPQNLLTGWKAVGAKFTLANILENDYADNCKLNRTLRLFWPNLLCFPLCSAEVRATLLSSGCPRAAPSLFPSQVFPPGHLLHVSSCLGVS